MSTSPGRLNLLTPAKYRISVLGVLDENMTDYLCGLTIEYQKQDPGSGKSIVCLTGSLADQAALLGALNILYNMRMPLLSVEYLGVS